jgi:outer membrane protein OmpU
MNKFKKLGLTALAGSLAVTSAIAGELSVSGGASLGVSNISNSAGSATGKSWTMGNSVTMTGSGELDNGLNVSVSFELDNGTANGTTSPFDSHSLTVSSDELGTLVFHGHGGDSAQGAVDGTAAGNLWDAGTGISGNVAAAAGGNNMMHYTLPSIVDDLTIAASYTPHATNDSHTSYALTYSGVEGLTVNYGRGDSGAPGSEITSTTMKATYAVGSFTLGVSNTEADKTGASDREVTSYGITYTVSDDLSIGYGQETFDREGATTDEETRGYNVSYTTGGMTLGAAFNEGEGLNHTAGSTQERWKLTASFAF